jgi:hypothetical protein
MLITTFAPNQILFTEDNGNRHFKSYSTNISSVKKYVNSAVESGLITLTDDIKKF